MNTIKDLAVQWWESLPIKRNKELLFKYHPDESLDYKKIENIFYNEVILKWYVGKYGKIEFDYNEKEIRNIYLKEHSKEEPMKNLFLISTDKPSRLRLDDGELVLGNSKLCQNTINYKYQNIYITSDEEIEEGNWRFDLKDNDFYKTTISELGEIHNCKKIILTTDQDLIADGVQAIDDEFLEWFVSNPSCEEVSIEEEDYSQKCKECGEIVKRGCSCTKGCFMKSGNFIPTDKNINYKIIIPKEEPKDVILGYKTSLDAQMLDKVEPKQETLEEAAENYFKLYEVKEGFIDGASWQQEQILQFLYSELTERRPYSSSKMCEEVIKFIEQFKKK